MCLFAERDPAYNPLVALERALRRPVDVSYKCLIAGTIGNGKTSELHHFADRLAPHRMIVLVAPVLDARGVIGIVTARRVQVWGEQVELPSLERVLVRLAGP